MKNQLKIGQEYPIKGEDQYIFKMVQDVKAQMARLHGPGSVSRQAHPKQHGLVRAEFIVEPDQLREDLRVGIFATTKTYPAWIRFSSFSTQPKPDIKKDVRGMAIKVIQVPGHKLLSAELHSDNQDFLLVSNETFAARDVHRFQRVVSIVTGSVRGFKKIWEILANLRTLLRARSEFVRVSNLLQIPYWSTTPYQFGGESRAVKYHVVPRSNHLDPIPKKPKDWYLREAMIRTLGQEDVWFDFMVQFQEDPHEMPIEDATVKWSSSFHKVASIRIPSQDFASEEELRSGRNMSFSPWHSLPAHRPLGGLNRARRAIYSHMSAFRMKENEAQATHPSRFLKLKKSNNMATTPTNTNRAIVMQMLQAFEKKDVEKVLSFMADDVLWFTQGDPKAIPFAGTHRGKKEVLGMFVQEGKLIKAQDFQLKSISGGNADDNPEEPVVVTIHEKVLVLATKKTYEMDFSLTISLKDQKVVGVVSLMDTLAVARAFDTVS